MNPEDVRAQYRELRRIADAAHAAWSTANQSIDALRAVCSHPEWEGHAGQDTLLRCTDCGANQWDVCPQCGTELVPVMSDKWGDSYDEKHCPLCGGAWYWSDPEGSPVPRPALFNWADGEASPHALWKERHALVG